MALKQASHQESVNPQRFQISHRADRYSRRFRISQQVVRGTLPSGKTRQLSEFISALEDLIIFIFIFV